MAVLDDSYQQRLSFNKSIIHGVFAILLLSLSAPSLAKETNCAYLYSKNWRVDNDQDDWGVKDKKPNPAPSAVGVAVDRKRGLVYTLVRRSPHVRVFTENGKFVRAWSPEKIISGHMIHVDGQGNLWIPDSDAHIVAKYSPDGKTLLTLGVYGERGNDDRHFSGPTDVTTTTDGKHVFI